MEKPASKDGVVATSTMKHFVQAPSISKLSVLVTGLQQGESHPDREKTAVLNQAAAVENR